MTNWSLVFIFLAPIIGGVVSILFREQAQKNYKLVLSFSGAFLFTIILLHLFPEVFGKLSNAGLYVLIGFFIQVLLEQLTRGVEHGHFHAHKHGGASVTALIAGLSLHSFLDGLPLANASLVDESHQALLYGIGIHKIPEGFALASILLISNYRVHSIMLYLVFFSLVAPGAIFVGNFLHESQTVLLNGLIAVALGSFLHVSTTILFESESSSHHFDWKRIAAIGAGAGMALLFG